MRQRSGRQPAPRGRSRERENNKGRDRNDNWRERERSRERSREGRNGRSRSRDRNDRRRGGGGGGGGNRGRRDDRSERDGRDHRDHSERFLQRAPAESYPPSLLEVLHHQQQLQHLQQHLEHLQQQELQQQIQMEMQMRMQAEDQFHPRHHSQHHPQYAFRPDWAAENDLRRPPYGELVDSGPEPRLRGAGYHIEQEMGRRPPPGFREREFNDGEGRMGFDPRDERSPPNHRRLEFEHPEDENLAREHAWREERGHRELTGRRESFDPPPRHPHDIDDRNDFSPETRAEEAFSRYPDREADRYARVPPEEMRPRYSPPARDPQSSQDPADLEDDIPSASPPPPPQKPLTEFELFTESVKRRLFEHLEGDKGLEGAVFLVDQQLPSLGPAAAPLYRSILSEAASQHDWRSASETFQRLKSIKTEKIGEQEVSDVLASFAECEHLNFFSNFFFNDAKEALGELDSSLCLKFLRTMTGNDLPHWEPLIAYLEKKPRVMDADLARRLMSLSLKTGNVPTIWKVLELVRERGLELGFSLYAELISFFVAENKWEDSLAIVDQMHTNSINLTEGKIEFTLFRELPEESVLIAECCRFTESFLLTGAKIFFDWVTAVRPSTLSVVPNMQQSFRNLVEACCRTKSGDILLSLVTNTGKPLEFDPWLIEKMLSFKETCMFISSWLLQQERKNALNLEKKIYMQLLIKLAQFDEFQQVVNFYTAFKAEIELTSVVLIILAKTQAKGFRAEDPMILFQKISTLGFSPDPAVVSGLFDSCYTEGDFLGALKIFQFMTSSSLPIPHRLKMKALDVCCALQVRELGDTLLRDYDFTLKGGEPAACQRVDASLAVQDYGACAKFYDFLQKTQPFPFSSGLFERFAIAAFKGKFWDIGLHLTQQVKKANIDISLDQLRRLMVLFDDEPNHQFAMRIFELGLKSELLKQLTENKKDQTHTLMLRDVTLVEANLSVVTFVEFLGNQLDQWDVSTVAVKLLTPTSPLPLPYFCDKALPPPFYFLFTSSVDPVVLSFDKRPMNHFDIEHVAEGIKTHFRPPPAFSISPTEPNTLKIDPQSLKAWLSRFPIPLTGL